MDQATTISVTVNGEPMRIEPGTRLVDLLARLGEPSEVGLVERNRRYVRKEALAEIILEDGDSIEVILPAFGG